MTLVQMPPSRHVHGRGALSASRTARGEGVRNRHSAAASAVTFDGRPDGDAMDEETPPMSSG